LLLFFYRLPQQWVESEEIFVIFICESEFNQKDSRLGLARAKVVLLFRYRGGGPSLLYLYALTGLHWLIMSGRLLLQKKRQEGRDMVGQFYNPGGRKLIGTLLSAPKKLWGYPLKKIFAHMPPRNRYLPGEDK